ncbi:MAG TPA: recombinase family protein [Kiritimatiellia bacterium]|nr:recombinase family protein [Kiritimatiellia bacterium]
MTSSTAWVCLPDRYDDGGFSGGNIERPALKRLLNDVQDGRVDCVLTYKVDRLSRSLMDFSRIMEILDRHEVSFVSVTQQFNTTSSMGRLTLNILLSFAQFEREIIAERTQDKMSAARRKGKWVGGCPVLGYDIAPGGGKLLVNPEEAARVRGIFGLYLREESLLDTAREVEARGWTLKLWTNQKGRAKGGKPFNKNSIFKLLTNMIYIGKIDYKGNIYEGEHEPIIDDVTWQGVQTILRRNGQTGGTRVRNKYGALLKGIIRCVPCNAAMVHALTAKKGCRKYRYYVCSSAQKRGWDTCPTKSIPAMEAEQFVVDRIRAIGKDPNLLTTVVTQGRKLHEAKRNELQIEIRQTQERLKRDIEALEETEEHSLERVELRDQIRAAEQRFSILKKELDDIGSALITDQEARTLLADFDQVWEALTPKECVRVVQLLIEEIGYDGQSGSLSITFRPNGINALRLLKQETS